LGDNALYQFKIFFAMVACDVHDDTGEELLALESAMPSEKKKTPCKTKQSI